MLDRMLQAEYPYFLTADGGVAPRMKATEKDT
jgi:hypothetical protein